MIARATPALQALLGASMFALAALSSLHAHAAPVPPASLPDNRIPGDAPVPAPVREAITADTSGGYARILVTFRAPTAVSASIADGVLTIRTAKPVDADMVGLVGKLATYITSGRRDPDRLTYRFGLGVPVALHTSISGGRTAIDLVPESFAGIPPDLPQQAAPPRQTIDVAKLPVIRVRVAEYANFTRLVFDWPTRIAYTVYPGRGRVALRFETLARPDFTMIQSRTPAWVKNAGWRIEGKALLVEFDTDSDSTFSHSRADNKVMLDVLAPRTDAAAYAAAVRRNEPEEVTATPGTIIATPEQPTTQTATAPPATLAPAVPEQTAAVASVAPSANLLGDGAEFRFPQARGHAIAVFVRGETTWVVLDNHPALEGATLFANIAPIVSRAEASQAGTASVIRLRFKSPLVATIVEDEAAMRVTFAPAGDTPRAVGFSRGGAGGVATLTAQLAGAARVIKLNDPDAGDRVLVVPARPGRGVQTPRHFVELEALQSISGIAIIPYADDVAVAVRGDLIEFSRPEGLSLSTASGTAPEPVVEIQRSGEGPAFIDFARWGAGVDDVYERARALRAAAAKLPESDANKARLVLARFLVANELAPEALGIIDLMQASDQRLANDPALNCLRGVASYQMGRYADARVALSSPWLDTDPHAALWRGLVEAKMQRWAEARRDLAAADGVLHRYPHAWTTQVRLARASTGLAVGDLATASDALQDLGTDLSPRAEAQAQLLKARLLAARGHTNQAIAALKVVETSDQAPVAAEAIYARVETELAAGRVKPAEAIAKLEQLRYRWRGDTLELRTLRKLGALYFGSKRWREGLSVLRIAAQNFAGTDLARGAQDDMRHAFSDLFLKGKAGTMPPIEALSLFYEFIELTPIGSDGDDMIRRLADRLVTVDLLGPAEQLLDHQVEKRLEGVARSVIATRLAAIYLLDHKPAEALRVLNATRQTRLPDEVNATRRLLEARALAALKQYDSAIDLVADDETAEAARLRADIYWESGNWAIAGAKTEEMLGNRWQGTAPLSAPDRDNVMRAGIAYSMAGDEVSLGRLRTRYLAKMNASPDASGFAVVTERIERQGVAFRDLAHRIASVDTLERFMIDFRKHEAAAAARPTRTAAN